MLSPTSLFLLAPLFLQVMPNIRTFQNYAPLIDPSAFVDESAIVIGDVHISAEATIWPGVIMRGDQGAIRIGTQSNIQDGTIIHATGGISQTIIGSGVTVGHRVILHGCLVEDDCLIGMGAILLDNCVIGKGSIIGAGALVTAGTTIPPSSLVLGSPAKVIRSISEADHKRWITHSKQAYLELGKIYKKECSNV